MNILIIGAGNMGATYAKSFLHSHFIKPEELFILEKSETAYERLADLKLSNIFTTPGEYVSTAEVIILAVKPQDYPDLHPIIYPFIHAGQTILSIMAGVSLETLAKTLQKPKLVRAMPNLPAQIGMGMTVFSCSPEISPKELLVVQNLLNTTGKSMYVEDEKLLDSATAVSGSGPAYVYYFMDAMVRAGVELGFTAPQAELLVAQTFMGSIHLQNQNDLSCRDLMKKVASRGGTTEAAFRIFDGRHLDHHIVEGLRSAYKRSVELGRKKPEDK
jgi:pyrroline-5-carboxylate reductase